MKILLGCINVNGLAGSEMYHFELARELSEQNGCDLTLFSLIPINYEDQVRKELSRLGIKQIDSTNINPTETFDLIIASQPQTNEFLINSFPNIPVISIIHSEVRAEDPILHPQIKHYIVIRESIRQLLISYYKISPSNISLIYNPINTSRFNSKNSTKHNKTTGIFIGGITDSLRFESVGHLVKHCIEQDWDLYLMSGASQRYDFDHPNIRYIDPTWGTEHIVKNMNFTAGILLGRTTLEGLHCGVPGYVYDVNKYGNILNITLMNPEDEAELLDLSDSKTVVKSHIELYNKIIHENNIQNI
jgi:hypothetical protein